MDDAEVMSVLEQTADAVVAAIGDLEDWGLAGTRSGQHHSDLAADRAATAVLEAAGLGWLSEESGTMHLDREVVVVVDPLDGSTNAHRGIPWFAVSLCAVDGDGSRAALVLDVTRGSRFTARRGGGARLDGAPIGPSAVRAVDDAIVGLSGLPPRHLGWDQFRSLGAAALDLCAVASGVLDGFVDCTADAHGPWDYLGASLICREAGAAIADAFGRDLLSLDHAARRTPVAAATPELLDELIAGRRSFGLDGDPRS